jgi:hypothetical protein
MNANKALLISVVIVLLGVWFCFGISPLDILAGIAEIGAQLHNMGL